MEVVEAPDTGRKRRKRGGKKKRKQGKTRTTSEEPVIAEDAVQLESSKHVKPETETTSEPKQPDSITHSGKEMSKTEKRKRKGHKPEVSPPAKKSKDEDEEFGDGLDSPNEEIMNEFEEMLSHVNQYASNDAYGESKMAKSKKKKKTLTNGKASSNKKEKMSEKEVRPSKPSEKPQEQKPVFDFETPERFLASLLAPIGVERFLSEFWEKKPLLVQRKKRRFSDAYKSLFSRKIFEEILTKRNVEFVSDVNVCRYVGEKRESLNGEGRATRKKIKNLFDKEKATVQFHQPQRFEDQLWRINEQLESFFHSLVGANVYITPQDSQGLAPHYDDVDIFVLQLEGQKQWRLYKPLIKLPRDYSGDLDQDAIGKPTHNITLTPGDLMYLPRGTIHQAVAPADSPANSTHVTISTYQRSSWGDLLSIALPGILQTAVETNVMFRKGLPHSYLSGDEENFTARQAHLKKMLQNLSDHLESHDQAAANEMMCDFMANRLPPFIKDGSAHEPKGPMPTEESKVRLAFPDHMYITDIERKVTGQGDVSSEEEEELESDEEELEEKDDDDEEEDEDDEEEVALDGSYLEQISKNGKEDEEEEEEDEDEEQDQFYVYHSFKNTRGDHMMTSEPKQCYGLKFSPDCMSAMNQLIDAKDKWTLVSDLYGTGKMQLLVSLWSEGLVEVQ